MPYKDPEKRRAARSAWRKANRERINAYRASYEAKPETATRRLAYREANRERENARAKAWYENNKKRVSNRNKKYRQENSEKIAIQNKAYREANSQRIRAYREANRERIKTRHKAYREANRAERIENNRRRSAKKKQAAVFLTENEKQVLLALEHTRQELQKETGKAYHIDHILPLAHGGLHHPLNLRILDGTDNSSKRDKLLPEAIALAPEHFRLYSKRVSPERAWEFVRQLAAGLGLSEEDLDALITGKPLKSKPTLEDFMA